MSRPRWQIVNRQIRQGCRTRGAGRAADSAGTVTVFACGEIRGGAGQSHGTPHSLSERSVRIGDASGLDEQAIRDLDLPEERQSFSRREKLAIQFAEKIALDHRSIGDGFVAELRTEFSDAEIVELGMMIGQYIGFGRLLVALGIDREASEPYLAGASDSSRRDAQVSGKD